MNAVSPPLRSLAEQSQKLVVWVFRDGEGQWSLRREGDINEHRFGCREDAIAFAQLPSGRFITEYRGYYG